MTNRFGRRFGSKVAVLHSRLTQRQRWNEWNRIRCGDATLVVGARSAIFAPVDALGLIVIDEEQEHTYQSETKPGIMRVPLLDYAARYQRHPGSRLSHSCSGNLLPDNGGQVYTLQLADRPGSAILPSNTNC